MIHWLPIKNKKNSDHDKQIKNQSKITTKCEKNKKNRSRQSITQPFCDIKGSWQIENKHKRLSNAIVSIEN